MGMKQRDNAGFFLGRCFFKVVACRRRPLLYLSGRLFLMMLFFLINLAFHACNKSRTLTICNSGIMHCRTWFFPLISTTWWKILAWYFDGFFVHDAILRAFSQCNLWVLSSISTSQSILLIGKFHLRITVRPSLLRTSCIFLVKFAENMKFRAVKEANR